MQRWVTVHQHPMVNRGVRLVMVHPQRQIKTGQPRTELEFLIRISWTYPAECLETVLFVYLGGA